MPAAEQSVPFRWDLITPDQLGSLLRGTSVPDRWQPRRLPLSFQRPPVYCGSAFTELFNLLRTWIDDDGEPWPVIRRKLRFVGVTSRTKTSPNTYRWQQHAAWTRQLPARAVVNVSLQPFVWSYFGDHQTKLTRIGRDPALAQPWLRALVAGLNS